MALYAIADLHLSYSTDKPMSKFGAKWLGYENKIRENIKKVMKESDVLLIPGDISWAMKAEESLADMRYINELPVAESVLIRGNHDYWWTSLGKQKRLLHEAGMHNIRILHNNALSVCGGRYIIVGTRGWLLPDDSKFTPADRKYLDREVARLILSLEAGRELQKKIPGSELIGMTHYPPLSRALHETAFTEAFEKYGVKKVVFGHVHHADSPYKICRHNLNNIEYSLTACDQIDFSPFKI